MLFVFVLVNSANITTNIGTTVLSKTNSALNSFFQSCFVSRSPHTPTEQDKASLSREYKTIGDEGITVDFSIIKVHTSN